MKKLLILALAFCFAGVQAQSVKKPNIIFIVIDDLNDYVGHLGGQPQVETPNIDSLANNGMYFSNAVCTAPGCAPSRASFLSGKDLSYTAVYTNNDYLPVFRDNFNASRSNEEVWSMPEYLKDSAGYYTYGINKIFHSPYENDYDDSTHFPCDRKKSWNFMRNYDDDSITDVLMSMFSFDENLIYGPVPDEYEKDLVDYKAASDAVSFLDNPGNTCGKPFFLAVGFHRPHSARLVPQKYFHEDYSPDFYAEPYNAPYNNPVNAYPYNGIVMPPQPEVKYGDYYALPQNGTAVSLANVGSMYDFFEDYKTRLSPEPPFEYGLTDEDADYMVDESLQANYVSAYVAAVNFIDAQVGRIMDAVRADPSLARNTVIVVISDHGYALGEKRHYGKWALWETDIRIPFIVYDPKMKTKGKVCESAVSTLDIFPTMCDFAKVSYPKFSNGTPYLDGMSLTPLLNNATLPWERGAVTSYQKSAGSAAKRCSKQYSVRTDQYHLIRYNVQYGAGCNLNTPVWEEELYEIGKHRSVDPNEWKNLAYDPKYAALKSFLSKYMPGGENYLKKTQKVVIQNGSPACLYNRTDKVKLKGMLYNADGSTATAETIAGYQFKWTNSLSNSVRSGNSITFNLTDISTTAFNANAKLTLFLEVSEIATGKVIAYATQTIALAPAGTPVTSFSASADAMDVLITDYVHTGNYKSSSWNFGDGVVIDDIIPQSHTYAAAGTYTITNTLYYGNDCSVSSTAQVTILPELRMGAENNMILYPNPANDQFTLNTGNADVQKIEIFSTTGELLYTMPSADITENSIVVPTAKLANGIYILKVTDTAIANSSQFEVIH